MSNDGFQDQTLLTVPEVAKVLRVSRMTIYRLVNSGQLPSVRVSPRSIRIPLTAARALIEGGSR